MNKIYSLLALALVLTLISAGSALAREGAGLNGTSSFKDVDFNYEIGPAHAEDFAAYGRKAVDVARLTDYRQDDPVAAGENAAVLALGPYPEAIEKAYNQGTLIGSFLSTESEGWVRANPVLGEYGPMLPVGAAF
jgi:hypothetical protein